MSNKPLTKRQKAVLAQLAVRAYKQLQAYGCPLPSLRDWRHDEVWAATGITESLTKATQEHYVPIYNRLASYLGCAPVKDRTWSEMDKAIHNLRDAMQRYEITPDYLAEIVRDQLHLPCTGRDVYQALRHYVAVEHVQHLMYTVINRGREDARKLASETGQDTYEPHADPRTMPPGGLRGHVGAVIVDEFPAPNPSTSRGWHNTARFPF